MACKCGKRLPKKGKSTLRNQYNKNGPAQPACKKNVTVDKFFAPRSTLASWLTSNVHQLKLDKDPLDRVWLTLALSALSISAEYLCHLLIALSVK